MNESTFSLEFSYYRINSIKVQLCAFIFEDLEEFLEAYTGVEI